MKMESKYHSRTENLIEQLQNLYHPVFIEPDLNENFETRVNFNEIIALIESGSYTLENILESDFMKNMSFIELKDAATELYGIFTNSSQHAKKINASLLLYRIFSFYLPDKLSLVNIGTIPYQAVEAIEANQFDKSIKLLEDFILSPEKASESILKAIGMAFDGKAFQMLEQLVQNSIEKKRPQLFEAFDLEKYTFSIPSFYHEYTEIINVPVRIELSSCVGSDIFLLAMNNPNSAKCINISVDLMDGDKSIPPIKVYARIIKEKGIRLTSHDLSCSKLITSLEDIFNLRNDDLSLLKAAVISSGLIPPSLKDAPPVLMENILEKLLKHHPGYDGIELVTEVVKIPRGSGLAVSTNLLAGMVIALLRFTGQNKEKEMTDTIKNEAAIRAIYGEWLGGSGGGWQDYGGMWGGFKEIKGIELSDQEDGLRGDLLPSYQVLPLTSKAAEIVLGSMVLVNGGTGQDVGPILKMISRQFITKNDIAWAARNRTQNRYEKIKNALMSGNPEVIGELETYDFKDRVLISPLANNLYHDEVMEELQNLFQDDLWGYDSTGGRAGAGGVFWVHPEKKKSFEKAFIKVATDKQKKLEGQMHFSSPPLIYQFQLNETGVTINISNKKDPIGNDFSGIIPKVIESESNSKTHSIKKHFGFNQKLFQQLQQQYQDGKISIEGNINRTVNPDIEKYMSHMGVPGSDQYNEYFEQGLDYLKDGIAAIILNGGESTRYGTQVIRSINPSIFLDNKYCSPVELKLSNIALLKKQFNANISTVFVNGYFTDYHTKRVLKENNSYGLEEESIFHCDHEVIHRVVPTQEDLKYWYTFIREKKNTNREEELDFQYHGAMLHWSKEMGGGNIYQPVGLNKTNTLVSPGHFFSFLAIIEKGVLGKLIKKGIKRLVISSNDNLMSTIDPAILAYHINKCNNVTSEIVPRLFDRGGAPVWNGKNVEIFEDFRFADSKTLWKTPFFNPITTWIEVESLLKLLKLEEEDVHITSKEKKEKCQEAILNLADKVSSYPVLKHLTEDMGQGISYKFPVIQFEKLFGDLISLLAPDFLIVPKLLRHTQIKSVDHIYQVYTDQSLEVLKTQILMMQTKEEKILW